MALTCVVSEILKVKQWRDLEIYCDVYVGGKVRVAKFMIFLDLQHRGSK